MADVAMESEGKAAGGRAVQRRLILWLSVLWKCGIFCSVLLVHTRKIVGFLTHLTHLAKIPLLKEGIYIYI
jgi:hypothetical protein